MLIPSPFLFNSADPKAGVGFALVAYPASDGIDPQQRYLRGSTMN